MNLARNMEVIFIVAVLACATVFTAEAALRTATKPGAAGKMTGVTLTAPSLYGTQAAQPGS